MINNVFTKTPVSKIAHSNQNLSHMWSGSMDMGYLVPVDWQLINPNETLKGNTEAYIQFAPMTYPVMHRINCKLYHFFVPLRILWKYWEKFSYEASNEEVLEKYPMLSVVFDELFHLKQLKPGTLSDYLGIPVRNFVGRESISADLKHERINVLSFMAYQKIWNDYFRDENLSDNIFDDDDTDPDKMISSLYFHGYTNKGAIDSQPALQNLFKLRKKAWEKDYFTSATPQPQQGESQVVPIDGTGNIVNEIISKLYTDYAGPSQQDYIVLPSVKPQPQGAPPPTDPQQILLRPFETNQDSDLIYNGNGNPVGEPYAKSQLNIPIQINGLTFSLNDLRLASAVQRYQEAMMRGGHRYKEAIITMYNQIVPDYRLDRPEFLASVSIPVVVGEVAQTSQTTTDSPQGQLAGRATVYGSDNQFKYHSDEHGIFMTLACVLPRSQYCDGLPRKFSILDRFDLHNRYFENLGDQAILMKEIYLDPDGTKEEIDETFGYAPRYSEYKFSPSTIHGDFLTSLDFMTLTRFIGNTPRLNEDFITVDDETSNRAFAVVSDVQHLYCTFYNKLHIRRAMQGNPIPKLI